MSTEETVSWLREYTPKLADAPPELIVRYANLVELYAPIIAKDPIITGNIVRHLIEEKGSDGFTIIEMITNLEGRILENQKLRKELNV